MVDRIAPSVAPAVVPLVVAIMALPGPVAAQRGPQWAGIPPVEVDDVTLLHTADEPNILVRVVARGLSDASSFAFLPDGDILVTEKAGALRLIRDGVLEPMPVAELSVRHALYSGLSDVVLHPDYARNRLVYITYATADELRITLARGRYEGGRLNDLEVLFQHAGGPIGASANRIVFAPDGNLFMTVGGAFNIYSTGGRSQDPLDHAGKVLRLRDDGTVPDDNPFAGDPGHLPEIFSMGHRNPMGVAFHPTTGELWASEHAPQGGDEVNIIRAGHNYGWPIVSYGRDYSGPRVSERWHHDGFDVPTIVWLPSVAPSGMIFYTGDRFPRWRGNLFIGALKVGRINRTGHIERVILNDDGEEIGREAILAELRQRIRDVRQGPDGLIYALTDEDDGTGLLLRIEPAVP